MADWDNDDDFEALPTAPLPTATLTRPRPTPNVTRTRVSPPTTDITPLSTSDTIHDNGTLYGLDPDFADNTHDSAAGTAYAIPSAVDVLRVPEPAKRRARRTTAKAADDAAETSPPAIDAGVDAPTETVTNRKLARQQRIAQRRAARVQADNDRDQEDRDAPPRATGIRVKRTVVAIAFLGAAATIAVVGFKVSTGQPDNPSAAPTTVITTTAAPTTPVFAAGRQCVPGQLPDGRLVSNGSSGRASGPQTIASMDSAYYGSRDASSVASYFASSMRIDARAMQRDITSYLPPAVTVTYCLQVSPTNHPDVYDVDLIESRDGVAPKTIRQTVTTAKQADGTYLITAMLDRR